MLVGRLLGGTARHKNIFGVCRVVFDCNCFHERRKERRNAGRREGVIIVV